MLWVKINTSLYNKFILDCYKRDITIYNTIKKNDYYILIKEDDYKKLKSIWYIKYQFIKYKGLLYIKDILYRYRIIIGSSIMGIILLFILSNIIIKIDIMSNNSDLKYYIKEELKELGIKEGYFKKSYKEVEEILKKIKDNSNNRIEWIEIENIGMKYIVKVVERKEVNEEKKKDYCNIISNSDAIVKNIYYSKGESKIYIGQSVKENDVFDNDIETITNRLKENQLKLMMDQIQPHFLFNTLSAIRILIKMEPEMAYDAMYDFSKYLRANIDNVNNIDGIDFASEVDHIKSYVNIEKIRFGDRVNAVYDIQCDDFFVPPLSIQSLVENAIQYGILPKMRGGTIWLRSYETNDYDVVEIEDDGVGFTRDTAAHLFSIYASDDDKVGMESNQVLRTAMTEVMENLNLTDSTGNPIVFTTPVKNNDLTEEHQSSSTMNIFLRLREMSGAKFEIASTEGEGTLIRVLIPKN